MEGPACSPRTTIAIAAATVIPIDSTWLTNNGPAPYVLNQAGATYQLQTDVTTNGTAFVVLNKNITLDLNGHTVTYGNSAPVTVTNGGFETGSGTSVPGWNITQGPGRGAGAQHQLPLGQPGPPPEQLLHRPDDRLRRDPHQPAQPHLRGHDHAGEPRRRLRTTLTLSVIDSVTGQVLGTGSSVNTRARVLGDRRVHADDHRPGEAAGGRHASGGSDDLARPGRGDAGCLVRLRDHRLGALVGQLPGFANLPASVQTNYATNYLKTVNFTVENGSIVQGQGNGTNSSPLFFEGLNGLTVNDVTTYDTGIDTTNLDGRYLSGNVVIVNSTFQDGIPNVTNRMAGPATVSFFQTKGNILVEGNQIIGSPQSRHPRRHE